MEFFYEVEADNRQFVFFKKKTNIWANTHFHAAVELLFVQEGEFKVVVDGKKKIMRANDACFVDSFLLHQYEWGETGVGFVVLGSAETFKDIFETLGGTPPTFFHFENFTLLDGLQKICTQKYKNEATGYMVFCGALRILLSEISQKVPYSIAQQGKDARFIVQVLKYAGENLTGDLSLQAIAKEFGYSYEYLSRILHSHLFENWKVYVNRLRARRVHMLLQRDTSGASVLQLALDCGFSSSKTFYRAYKKEFGKSPRKNIK
ncbi:MAG: AraC family transcriptional regulator [Clostridia bacterium]|nr:AraC family transcriptional regulator [Clostridia bacterium]